MADDSAADAERLSKLRQERDTAPLLYLDGSATFPAHKFAWVDVDFLIQMLDSRGAALRDARADIDLARDTSHSLYDRVMQQQTEIDAQRIEIARLRAAPSARVVEAASKIAAAAHDLDDDAPNKAEIWEMPAAMSITAGMLRELAAALDAAAPQREPADG